MEIYGKAVIKTLPGRMIKKAWIQDEYYNDHLLLEFDDGSVADILLADITVNISLKSKELESET